MSWLTHDALALDCLGAGAHLNIVIPAADGGRPPANCRAAQLTRRHAAGRQRVPSRRGVARSLDPGCAANTPRPAAGRLPPGMHAAPLGHTRGPAHAEDAGAHRRSQQSPGGSLEALGPVAVLAFWHLELPLVGQVLRWWLGRDGRAVCVCACVCAAGRGLVGAGHGKGGSPRNDWHGRANEGS